MRPPLAWMARVVSWRTLAVAATAAGGAALASWLIPWVPPPLSRLEFMLLLAVLGGLSDVVQAWRNEREQARRHGGRPAGLVKMIGQHGHTVTRCAPSGTVRIGLEVWKARCDADQAIPPGRPVTVRDVDGRVLVVEPRPR